MANSFCTNCGAPLKPNAKFCGRCGAKLVSSDEQPATSNTVDSNTTNSQNSNTVNTLKQKASAIVNEDTINNVKQKASTLLNEKNLNDVKEKASTFIHETNVNELKEQATSNVKKLPNWLKIVAVVLIVAIVGYGGYSYFSPERQAQKVAENYAEQFINIVSSDPQDISDDDIDNIAKTFIPNKQEEGKQRFSDLCKELASRGHFKNKPSYDVINVTLIDDNHAIVKIKFNTTEKIAFNFYKPATIQLDKVNGDWYINSVSGMTDN